MDIENEESMPLFSEEKDEQTEVQWQDNIDNELARKRGYANQQEMDYYAETQKVWVKLSKINVNKKTEKKANLTYLSWAWAHAEVKNHFPDVNYIVYENKDGWFYHHDGKTCWVKVGAVIKSQEYIEYLPVMDYRNKSIPVDKVTSFDVNKAVQRAKTKAVALHGLGLYIYAGEDLPESNAEETELKRYKSLYNTKLLKEFNFKIPQSEIDKAKKMTLEDFKRAINDRSN